MNETTNETMNETLIPQDQNDLEAAQSGEKQQNYDIPEFSKEAITPIVGEILEKRNAYSKAFRTHNGSMIAAVYKDPVHFNDDGEWKDFNNTLKANTDENMGEIFENTQSNVVVKIAAKANAKQLIRIKKGVHQLSWGLTQGSENQLVTADGSEQVIPNFVIQSNPDTALESRTAVIEMPKTKDEIREYNHQKTGVHQSVSKGYYPDILPGIDLQYVLQADKVKENIILKSLGAGDTDIRFTLEHPGLHIRHNEDGRIDFLNQDNGEEIVFSFPLPFMIDAAGAIGTDIHYQLTVLTEDESTLTLVPSQDWLNCEERTYPVIIDPVTETQKTQTDIDDTFVASKLPTAGYLSAYGSFNVGRNDAEGTCRALIKFNQLPQLDPGDIIYSANLRVWQYEFSAIGAQSFKMVAYEPSSAWSPATTWNTRPDTDYVTLDSQDIGPVQNGNNITITPKTFDITRLVRKWYDTGINNGIMLRGMDDQIRDAVARFFTSNFDFEGSGIPGSSAQYPTGFFYYKNATGLESYWSYHQQSLGRSGTGYVNDFNGNLVFVHADAATTGTRLPVGIRHIYNFTESNQASRFGYGWRINGMQRFESTGFADSPFVYTDEDGTKHYFYNDNGVYRDEDGLLLEYTAIDEGELKHLITCKDKSKLKFDLWGYLRRVLDTNTNVISYNYGPNSNGNFLGDVQDGSGKSIYFGYTTDMSKLSNITDTLGRVTNYQYDASGNLTKIIYPDGTFTQLGYSGHRLIKVTAPSGHAVEYTYAADMQVQRISKVTQKSGSTLGQTLAITYKNGNQTVFESCGNDGDIVTKTDNLLTTYQFDNMGRPINVRDNNGNSAAYDYYSTDLKNNKLNTMGRTQGSVNNPIQNPGFENITDPWQSYALTTGISYSVTRVADCGFMDKRSVKVTKTTSTSMAGIAQDVTISVKSNIHTLSAYVKTQSITAGTGSDAGAVLMVARKNTDGTHTILGTSKPVVGTTDVNINQGWKRVQVNFSVNPNDFSNLKMMGGINNATGTAWFDCFQVELGEVANKFNLINDPSFEISSGSGNGLKYWTGGETDAEDGRVPYTNNPVLSDPNNKTGQYQLQIHGAYGSRKSYMQAVNVSGEQGDIFHLGCLASAKPIPGREFRVAAAVLYESGDPKWTFFDFSPYSTEWQYTGGVVSTDDGISGSTRKYTALHIYIFFAENNNYAYFDSIQLIKDDGKSYVYDQNGELVSAETAAKSSHFSSDNNANITRMVTPTGTAFEYANDAKNNLKAARNAQGVETLFAYDDKGNPIESIIENTRTASSVVLEKTYFIRQKTSGKYLDVFNNLNQDNANVGQGTFNGGNNQKWKVLDGKSGYMILQPMNSTTRVLDVTNGLNTDGANVAIFTRNDSDAQKFKLKVLSDGSYQIAAKCAEDEKVLTNQGGYTYTGANIDIRGIVGEHPDQSFYFETAETGLPVSDSPVNGNDKTFFIRTRHSGQYWDVANRATANNSPIVQSYLNRGDNQRFRLEAVPNQTGYYFIHPLYVLNKVVGINSDNNLVLGDPSSDDRQKFAFTLNTNGTYRLQSKASNGGANTVGIAGGSYNVGANINASANQNGETQQFILEAISDTMTVKATYTTDQSRIKSLTDANGKITTFNYDTSNQKLLSIAEPDNHLTQYVYDANTDNLVKVQTKMNDTDFAEVQFTYVQNRITKVTRNSFDYDFVYDLFGNVSQIKIGTQTTPFLTNEYGPGNGILKKTTFANGMVVENIRDKMGRLISQNFTPHATGRCQFSAVYDAMGNVIKEMDTNTGRLFEYEYDLVGRLIGMERTGTPMKNHQLRLAYDSKNRVDYLTSKVDTQLTKTQYVYGDGLTAGTLPELISQVKINETKRIEYTYDNLARGCSRKLNTTAPFTTTYQIKKGTAAGTTTPRVESITNGTSALTSTLSYTYDVFGNILTVTENGMLKITHVYDMRNQLVKETNRYLGKEILYTYDTGGNRVTKKETLLDSPSTVTNISYGYETIWKDKLAVYNGQSITCDVNGNPTLYYNGMTLNWAKGRELALIIKSGVTTTYQYTTHGIRLEKETGGVKTHFYLNGAQIMTQICGSERFDFYADEAGLLFEFKYNGSDYYYIRNVQNDITGIIDAEGVVKVYYLYDSWGKLISITGDLKDTVGLKNPFRYRGYYYDNETGFYYLNSRYYDPEIGRFINPDIIMGTGDKDPMAYNLFLYCNNNPVNRQDPSGRSWGWISGWLDSTLKSAANWFIGLFRPQSSSNGAGGGGGGGSWGDTDFEGFSGGGGAGGGGSSWGGDSSSADIGHAVFEVGTTYCFDGALDFAKSPITTQIAVKSFSKGLKVGPIAAMFYANEIRLNYEQYAGNSDNIAIANWIDTAVLGAGVVVGALLAMSALPVVAVALIAVGAGVLISLSADRIEDALIE